MELFGIKFVPWNTPIQERLESLAAAGVLVYFVPLIILVPFLLYYITVYTSFWPIVLMYLIWLYVFDKDTPEQGGRRHEWTRSLTLWTYNKRYFPVTLIKSNGVELDPKRNYLFAAFPHGIVATGASLAFGTTACDYPRLFPHHKSTLTVLHMNFKMPICRDIMLSRGCCSASAKSLNYLLGQPEGGNVVVLFVGGIAEQRKTKPGTNEVVVRSRKGFVRIALQNGSPLVPVYSFGESDLYTIYPGITSIMPLWFNGRGLFQYNFGLIPKQVPINVVVGKPIEVKKVENPTQEQIDELHSKFIDELVNLFEENKYKYGINPEKLKIVIT